MVPSSTNTVTFEEFIQWYISQGRCCELHDGTIVAMPKPTGKHSLVTGFLIEELILAIIKQGKRGMWTIPREAIVKSRNGQSGYEPDIVVLDQSAIVEEPRWEQESIIEKPESVKLIVEVVSTNWRDDYFKKRADYEELGIPEYWIVDHAAIGGRNFLGNPKRATISLYQLVEGEYQVTQFRNNETIGSPTFPEFEPVAEQIFQGTQ
ncbi:MAG: Uma2 family endonuclease [Halothece sp.]|jgi:Uma2 family endonuclease